MILWKSGKSCCNALLFISQALVEYFVVFHKEKRNKKEGRIIHNISFHISQTLGKTFIRTLTPFMRAPPYDLIAPPEASYPNSITRWTQFQYMNLGGDIIIWSIAVCQECEAPYFSHGGTCQSC